MVRLPLNIRVVVIKSTQFPYRSSSLSSRRADCGTGAVLGEGGRDGEAGEAVRTGNQRGVGPDIAAARPLSFVRRPVRRALDGHLFIYVFVAGDVASN